MTFPYHRLPSGLCAAGLALVAGSAAQAHGVSTDQAETLIGGGNLAYMWSGAVHMLSGYDHLLFLFGVIFFLTRATEVVKFITAFTLGHSITLLSATLLNISANYFLIDAVIAVSVIYKGFDNLDGFRKTLGVAPPDLLWMVFGFGLIHGFGLSARLQQLPLPQTGLIARILSFNVGVELGQIAALVVMVVILASWRQATSFAGFSRIANTGLLVAGALLFLMQMHGYWHTAYPNEFGFSEDSHIHHHETMDAPAPSDRESIYTPTR